MVTGVLEGNWEDIVEHAAELKGRRVRVTILEGAAEGKSDAELDECQQRMLSWLDRWERTPLTDEERQVLDEFEAFRKEHPLRLHRLDLEENSA